MSRWSALGLGAAIILAAIGAVALTPPPGFTAASGLSGWPRLLAYAAAGIVLAQTAAPVCISYRLRAYVTQDRRGPLLAALGVAASLVIALINAARLKTDIADPLGPALWIISMLLILGYMLFPQVRHLGWNPLWPEKLTRSRWLPLLTLVTILALAAAIRLPALGDIPQGINPDEGDRATTSIDLLNGLGPPSWFDSGWFFINMVYFRLLALSLSIFGTNVFGGRMLTALCGIAFVGVIGWIGWRNFGARIGLVAAAFAAGMQMTIEHSRLITEAGVTGLLWAVSIGGFLEGARSGRLWAWALAGVSGGLGLYFYPSARLWAVGAVLTALVLLVFLRSRRIVLGVGLAAVASVVAVLPFVVHLTQHPDEAAGRYAQTAVLDPENQQRLAYLQPPEPLPELAALQVERTVGMFDRYPDGGGFLPTGHPVFGTPLAQLALVGAVYVLVRGWRDVRLAVLSIWFWLGLSGVALTVETPDYLRAIGMLPSLCFVIAVTLVDVVDRLVPLLAVKRRDLVASGIPACAAVLLLLPEVSGYFTTFKTMPSPWAPETDEGRVVAAMGVIGPVYSLETNEHMVNSGWVRLLAPTTEKGRVPNPGREMPFLQPVGPSGDPALQRPNFYPDAEQGFSVLFAPDPNQQTYISLVQQLYPRAVLGDGGGDQRQSLQVSPQALDDVDGVTLVDATGELRDVEHFGDVRADVPLPADLTWRAGVRFSRDGQYDFAAPTNGHVQLRLDGAVVADQTGPLAAHVHVLEGVHFVELEAQVSSGSEFPLSIDGKQLAARQTYRLMDAPWGLLAHVSRPASGVPDVVLDSMVSMAFWDPELTGVGPPNSLVWTGALVAPRDGAYRMAFASEDGMHLLLDGRLVDVAVVKPDDWHAVGTGTLVQLSAGAHQVQITLDVTHGGRELARWNWVPPLPTGAVDANAQFTVVPPWALRPNMSN
jgi:hypothetical protein